MTEEQSAAVPDHVITDVTSNPELVTRWVNDADFRRDLLSAPSPQAFAQQNKYNISAATSDWIKQRVEEIGIDTVLGTDYRIVAF
jgi:hypothetical protein